VLSNSNGSSTTHISASLGRTHLGRNSGGVGLEVRTLDSNGNISLEVTRTRLDADSSLGVGTSVNSDSSRRELKKVETCSSSHRSHWGKELGGGVTETTSGNFTDGERHRTEVHLSTKSGVLTSGYTRNSELIRSSFSQFGGGGIKSKDQIVTSNLAHGTLDGSLSGFGSSTSTSGDNKLKRSTRSDSTIFPTSNSLPLVRKRESDEVRGSSDSVSGSGKSESHGDVRSGSKGVVRQST